MVHIDVTTPPRIARLLITPPAGWHSRMPLNMGNVKFLRCSFWTMISSLPVAQKIRPYHLPVKECSACIAAKTQPLGPSARHSRERPALVGFTLTCAGVLQEKHVECAKLLLGSGKALNNFVSTLLDDIANLKAMLRAISIGIPSPSM